MRRIKNTFMNQIYSTLTEIRQELTSRWSNKDLKAKVSDFLQNDYPFDFFENGQYAFFSRDIMTPNYEFYYFMDIVRSLKLTPILFEYNGKFVAKNANKYHTCRLYFCDMVNGEIQKIEIKKIVDFNIWEGKMMHEIITKDDIFLKEVHRKLLVEHFPEVSSNIFDITNWFNKKRYVDQYYYRHFLSLFIRNGVLFENFLFDDKGESDFIKNKLLPSFDFVKDFFKVKPLIFPSLPIENEKNNSWLYYPHKKK